MDFPLARQHFYQEVQQPDAQINLAKAALSIAAEEYPNLEFELYLNALDTMAQEVEERLPPERYPLRVVQTLNRYLYEDLRFCGNTDNYYDPRNSFLNEVIDRRTGIPITLAVIYLEVAKRIDFPMIGIGMPGHFLVRPNFADAGIFIDVFNRGEILFPEDCQDKLKQLYGRAIELTPEVIPPVNSRQILARMLTNLKMIYLTRQEQLKALAAIERILLLFPDSPLELRDRGLLYYQLQRRTLAMQDLESYLDRLPMAEDAPVILQLINQLKRGLF
ncbi:SirB1 family protein [Geitlerinema calcuttense]|uniref:SirB1 family protein n=1 Tax=Geitlerinema calcuttense NRMC-F 0142 TaxID=2922238 RepID=A0ABT7LYZ6_9CYAN|nr:SirB1 family protein [Geitlerinema calcuttense]MCD8488397.1 SirB1 family protein [Desertifilum sp.]MDL5057218.1 SirB1 family protein [Geitlerinema calcuttense NRMC-F 0142]